MVNFLLETLVFGTVFLLLLAFMVLDPMFWGIQGSDKFSRFLRTNWLWILPLLAILFGLVAALLV